MTVFTRTWNAAYEASPANVDAASQGAQRIRELKNDLSERLEVDHIFGGASTTTDEGYHKSVHLQEQGADPGAVANYGVLYAKQVGAITELFHRDSAGNIIQITNAGGINSFPAGTLMLFQQTAAPTGWTKQTTHNNKALRVVTGAAGSGGATAFTSVFGSGKTTGSESSHTHSGTTNAQSDGQYATATVENVTNFSLYTHVHGFTTGAGSSHSHTLSLDLQYVDLIIAAKA